MPKQPEDKHTLRRSSKLDILTPEQIKDQKLERIFYTFFDINKNNVIDWNDFEMLFDKVKKIRGEESTEFKIVDDAMRGVWKGLLMETKGMGFHELLTGEEAVTIDEWKKLWSNFNPSKLPMWQKEYIKYMFFLIDTNGDKKIDQPEYTAVMKMYGVSEEMSKEAFEKFAKDEDGNKLEMLDYGHFVKLWNEYFTSGKGDSLGNFIFGPW